MGEETEKITHMNVGYAWNYSLEVERVVPVEGTRASAKTTEKFAVGGNTETYELSLEQIRKAKMDMSKEATT